VDTTRPYMVARAEEELDRLRRGGSD